MATKDESELRPHPDNLKLGSKYKVRYKGVVGATSFISTGIFLGLSVRKDEHGGKIRRLVVVFEMIQEAGYSSFKRAIPWYRIEKVDKVG